MTTSEHIREQLKLEYDRKSCYLIYADSLTDEDYPVDEVDLWRILGQEELFSIGKILLLEDNIENITFSGYSNNPFYIPDFILRYVEKGKLDRGKYLWDTTTELKEDLKQAIQSAIAMEWI